MERPNRNSFLFIRILPYFVVFVSSMAVMIIELTASRLVSKYFGTSLLTWTGVIGIVLGGISLGNVIGGRLADRFDPDRLATPILLVSSFLILLIFLLDLGLGTLVRTHRVTSITTGILARSIMMIFALFFLPTAALGLISPVMAKFALIQSARIGRTVGNIYAVGAVGSILGTFLTGYFLIPHLGLKTILFLVAAVLAALGLLVYGSKLLPALWMGGVVVIYLVTPASSADSETLYDHDSAYSHISVVESVRYGAKERVLILDGLIHNRYVPGNPDKLLYDYEKTFEALTRYRAQNQQKGDSLRTLTLGGGALTFPSYLERHYPQSRNEVVDIDAEVIRVAREYFDIPEDSNLAITIGDARMYVDSIQNLKEYDIVYHDAFNSFSVPSHLTTVEFTQNVAALLGQDGWLIANTIDIPAIGKFLSAYISTLEEVFPHVAVYVSPPYEPGKRSTIVLAAGQKPVFPSRLTDRSGSIVARWLDSDERADLLARNRTGILTDDYAPVDNLMAPVFLGSVE